MTQIDRSAERKLKDAVYNPGDLRLPEGVAIQPKRRVLLFDKEPPDILEHFDVKVRLYTEKKQRPTSGQEKITLVETTLPFFERRNGR